MSVYTSIKVSRDTATPALNELLQKATVKELRAAVGPVVLATVQDHLAANGRNKRGWPSSSFWGSAAKSTSWNAQAAQDSTIIITINKIGVRQRYHGGNIAPVKAKALAIPISPASYGKKPSDFPGMILIRPKKGAYLCGREQEMTGVRKDGKRTKRGQGSKISRERLQFLFKLVGGVYQAPDPSVLPSVGELTQVAKSAILDSNFARKLKANP
jgi:hypothetical protein